MDSIVETIQTLVGCAKKGKGKHTGSGKSGASACYASYTSVEDHSYDDDTIEPADACQARNDSVDPGSDDGEEAPDDDDEENDTFSSDVALEVAELGAVALLADTWNNDFDPVVSAQLIQANVQACLSFGKEKGKGKGKSKGRYLVRPSRLSLEDRRGELKAKTECRARGRKGHWAQDRECAMFPSRSSSQNQTRKARMTTQQHLSSQAKKVTTCVRSQ